jgi:hypothetical protein
MAEPVGIPRLLVETKKKGAPRFPAEAVLIQENKLYALASGLGNVDKNRLKKI